MSDVMMLVDPNSSIMKAWQEYSHSEEYANTKRWAVDPKHVNGSLWAAFEKGWSISKPEIIVAAAVYHGCVISLPRPARHHTILHTLDAMGIDAIKIHGDNQGFITSEGRYVNRVEAFGIAYRAKQLITNSKGPQLFSEDLW